MLFRLNSIVIFIILTGLLTGYVVRSRMADITGSHRILKSCTGCLTGITDSNRIVLISPVSGAIDSNYIEIYRQNGNSQDLLWKSPPSPIRSIDLADVNGDGFDELALTLYKKEPRDPKKDNRLHIYGWRDDHLYALWRGTSLSKPFECAAFGNVAGDAAEELITIERGRKNRNTMYLCVYTWNGFGFDLLTEIILDDKPFTLSVILKDSQGYGDIQLAGRWWKKRYAVSGMEIKPKEALQ